MLEEKEIQLRESRTEVDELNSNVIKVNVELEMLKTAVPPAAAQGCSGSRKAVG